MGAAGTGAETMFVTTVALLLVAQCVWSSPSAISPACSISCIREDDFVCLEQALLHGNKTNLKNLRSAIFQPNMPIPRYVIIDYYFENSSLRYCPDMDRDSSCCSTQWKADVCKTNSSNSWIWTRSSVYLLISPGALDYLSFQKFAYQFTAIPRINQACICLPAPCPGHNAKSIARRMTSKVYRYLSQPDSLDPTDNLDGNFMEFRSEYQITVPSTFSNRSADCLTAYMAKIGRKALIAGLIFYGLILFPLLSMSLTRLFRSVAEEAAMGSVVHWSFLWSASLATLAGLGWLLWSDFDYVQNSIQFSAEKRANYAEAVVVVIGLSCFYCIVPGIGFAIVSVKTQKVDDFPTVFPLSVLVYLMAKLSTSVAQFFLKTVQTILMWCFLEFSMMLLYRLAMVFFAAFSGPLIVWGNFVFVLSIWFSITCLISLLLILQAMAADVIVHRSLLKLKAYSWPMTFAVGAVIVAVAVSEITYVVTGLGYYEKHSFSDSFQTVVNFIAQAIVIGILGYTMKVILSRVDRITARALNSEPVMTNEEPEIHVHIHSFDMVLPVFDPRRRQRRQHRGYGATECRQRQQEQQED